MFASCGIASNPRPFGSTDLPPYLNFFVTHHQISIMLMKFLHAGKLTCISSEGQQLIDPFSSLASPRFEMVFRLTPLCYLLVINLLRPRACIPERAAFYSHNSLSLLPRGLSSFPAIG